MRAISYVEAPARKCLSRSCLAEEALRDVQKDAGGASGLVDRPAFSREDVCQMSGQQREAVGRCSKDDNDDPFFSGVARARQIAARQEVWSGFFSRSLETDGLDCIDFRPKVPGPRLRLFDDSPEESSHEQSQALFGFLKRRRGASTQAFRAKNGEAQILLAQGFRAESQPCALLSTPKRRPSQSAFSSPACAYRVASPAAAGGV
eukprot:TRINITY_DN77493_c0_g1_i1.p1 TRINITY_DN77493_c0_g1~~TRINITY_DN77493_c0_g1_i1.p1  ORF type:complete len:239 (+),score=58.80 TRINITY_DN77493_c0_g1_i1:103-717(+)